MSDTPTFASLLTQWTSGGPAARASVYAHLRAHPAEAAAVEASIRDVLRSGYPRNRVIAAEAMAVVYRDEEVAAAALSGALRQGDPSTAVDAVPVLQKLSPERAAPLLGELVLHAPVVFRGLSAEDHRWAGATAVAAGAAGADLWLTLLTHVSAQSESALLMGLADAAPRVHHDLSAVEPAVRLRLFHTGPGYAAGAALWRLTWRVHRDWLASIDPHSPRLEADHALLLFLIEVLAEHLGRRPNLAPVIRELLVRQGNDDRPCFQTALTRLTQLGGRGWPVLLPILGDDAVRAKSRAAVFGKILTRPGLLPLAHHRAHAVVLERAQHRDAAPPELLEAAVGVLAAIGEPAGFALPDILDLIVKQPDTGRLVVGAIPALAAGFPNATAAIARTLDRLRRSPSFSVSNDAFAALAEVFAALSLDAGPSLVEDTSLDSRTLDLLLQQSPWKDAPPEVRRRHALALADRLAAPRPEVRARAADLLRHYPDQLPAVWPALVAPLACGDEKAALLVLPRFRHLAPVADAVTPELTALFREPNPVYAARAVVALWRLGRMPVVADDLRAAVTASDDTWGWAVLRGVVDRVFQAHGLLHELTEVFAAAPREVAAKVDALLNPPEAADEAAITVHVRSEGSPRVNWNGVYQCVSNDREGGCLFFALMCAHGSEGFGAQKIWMIKHQRTTAGTGLADAKNVVERAVERLTATATVGDRHACVREYFGPSPSGPPKALLALLDHRLSWYRWAGLELLDAWGSPEHVGELIEDRAWDRSALVRTRALRMHQG